MVKHFVSDLPIKFVVAENLVECYLYGSGPWPYGEAIGQTPLLTIRGSLDTAVLMIRQLMWANKLKSPSYFRESVFDESIEAISKFLNQEC